MSAPAAAPTLPKSVASPASSFIGPQGLQIGLLVVCFGMLLAVTVISGQMIGDKNNLDEVQKKMGIILGVTVAIVLTLAIFTYLYIRSQPDMFVPIVLFMLFVNMEISLIALGGSVLQRIV
jgi:predicted Na+-dependent transporter